MAKAISTNISGKAIRKVLAAIVALLLPAPLLAVPSPGDCLQAPAAPEIKAAADPWYTPRGVPYVKGWAPDPTVRSLVTEAKKKPRRPAETKRCPTKW
jgi:hypothetical protein